MSREGLIKCVIKVLNENNDTLHWEHLCYIPKDTYLKFLSVKGINRADFADYISGWAAEDFNIELSMSKSRDIQILKALVQDKYKTVYPHLVRSSSTDHQGWLRAWISTHMSKELERK